MYTFAILAMLAIATLKLVDVVVDLLPDLARLRPLLTVVLSVAAVVVLDVSMFSGWDTAVRNDDVGLWITGFAVAGLTSAWRAAFAWLTHDRAAVDETLTTERRDLQRVA